MGEDKNTDSDAMKPWFTSEMGHQILPETAPSVAPVQKNWYLKDHRSRHAEEPDWPFVAAFGAEEAEASPG